MLCPHQTELGSWATPRAPPSHSNLGLSPHTPIPHLKLCPGGTLSGQPHQPLLASHDPLFTVRGNLENHRLDSISPLRQCLQGSLGPSAYAMTPL